MGEKRGADMRIRTKTDSGKKTWRAGILGSALSFAMVFGSLMGSEYHAFAEPEDEGNENAVTVDVTEKAQPMLRSSVEYTNKKSENAILSKSKTFPDRSIFGVWIQMGTVSGIVVM